MRAVEIAPKGYATKFTGVDWSHRRADIPVCQFTPTQKKRLPQVEEASL
jgi:hypothetical protein